MKAKNKKAKPDLARKLLGDHGGTILQPEAVPQPGHPSTQLYANDNPNLDVVSNYA